MRLATRPVVGVIALVAVVVLSSDWATSKKERPPACPSARYLLSSPLVIGEPATPVSGLEAGDSNVALDDTCDPIAPKRYKGTKKKGTRVRVKWPACEGLRGKVRLRGRIVDDCQTFTGSLRARRFKERFTATRSRCGDELVDTGGGEECDPPAAGTCSAECRRTVSAVVGAGGGQVTSLDDRLSVNIPAGALAGDTEITIRRLEPEELPPGALDLGLDRAYRLGPAGLQFQGPVTVALQQDTPARAQDGSLRADVGFLFTVNGSEIEILSAQRTRIDGGNDTVTASGMLTHFSDLYPFKSSGQTTGAEPEPLAEASVTLEPAPPIPVGASFLSTVIFVLTNQDLEGRADVFHTNLTDTDVVQYRGELPSSVTSPDAGSCDSMPLDTDTTVKIGEVQNGEKDGQPADSADGFLCYRCQKVGEQLLTGEITVASLNPCDDDLVGFFANTIFEGLCAVFGGSNIDDLTVEYEEPVECVDPSATTTTMAPTTSTSSTAPPTSTSTSATTTTTTTTLSGPPCGPSAFPTCDGACPPGQLCVPLRDFLGSDFCSCTSGGCSANECGFCLGADIICEANGPPTDCTDARCVPIIPPVSTTTSTTTPPTTSTSTTSSTSSTTTTTLLPCGLDATQSPPMCVGNCESGLICLSTDPGCLCVPLSFACKDDNFCGGLCPSPDQVCDERPLPDLDCVCFVRSTTSTTSTSTSSTTTPTSSTTTTTLMPSGPCRSLDGTVCGGECPDTQVCRALESRVGGGCLCIPSDSACPEGQAPDPDPGFCGGLCPREDQLCADDESGECICTGCRLFDVEGTPVCFGGCADQFSTCAAIDGGCACVSNNEFCQPQPGDGTCGGRCPSPLEGCVVPVEGPGCTCAIQP